MALETIIDTNQGSELHIGDLTRLHLTSIAKWSKFLGIFGLVILSISALFLIFGGGSFLAMSGLQPAATGAGVGIIAFYLIFIAIGAIPCIAMYKYSANMKLALANNDQVSLNKAFGNMKAVFMFYGILVAIYLAMILLSLVFLLATGGLAMLSR